METLEGEHSEFEREFSILFCKSPKAALQVVRTLCFPALIKHGYLPISAEDECRFLCPMSKHIYAEVELTVQGNQIYIGALAFRTDMCQRAIKYTKIILSYLKNGIQDVPLRSKNTANS